MLKGKIKQLNRTHCIAPENHFPYLQMDALEFEGIPILPNISRFIIEINEETEKHGYFGFIVEGVLLVS
jgi:hypothetical protein